MLDVIDQGCCADMLKVLANDTRLSVVQQLLEGPRQVHELNDHLQIDKTLLSHHLKILREGGVIETERDGKTVICRLAPKIEAAKRGRGIDLGCCQLLFDKNYLAETSA